MKFRPFVNLIEIMFKMMKYVGSQVSVFQIVNIEAIGEPGKKGATD